MLTPSRALTHAYLELVESPAQAQRVFELLGYQVESEPLPVSLDDLQLSGSDQEAVESFHLLSSYGDDFLIGLWQLNDLS